MIVDDRGKSQGASFGKGGDGRRERPVREAERVDGEPRGWRRERGKRPHKRSRRSWRRRTAELVAASDDVQRVSPAAATVKRHRPRATATFERDGRGAGRRASPHRGDAAASAPRRPCTRARRRGARAVGFVPGRRRARRSACLRPDVLVPSEAQRDRAEASSFLSRDASRAKTIAEQRPSSCSPWRRRWRRRSCASASRQSRFRAARASRGSRAWWRRRRRARAELARRGSRRSWRRSARSRSTSGTRRGRSGEEPRRRPAARQQVPAAVLRQARASKAVKELRLPSTAAEAGAQGGGAHRRRDRAQGERCPSALSRGAARPAAVEAAGPLTATAAVEKRRTWSFQPAPRKPVPDFDALHASFFRRLKEAKQSRPSTAVREFRLHERRSPQRRAELSKIEKDMREDENVLPENRWPPPSTRASVSRRRRRRSRGACAPTSSRRTNTSPPSCGGRPCSGRRPRGTTPPRRSARRWSLRSARRRTGGAPRRGRGRKPATWRGAVSLDARADVAASARRKQQSQIAKETVERVLMENNVYTYVEEGL